MCRSIKPLFNFDPPATNTEVQAAALQFVRKVSGFREPSKANEPAFTEAIAAIAVATQRLLDHLESGAQPRSREDEADKARLRAEKRFGTRLS